MLLLFLLLYVVCFASSLKETSHLCHAAAGMYNQCQVNETPTLCVERSQSIRITSVVNGTGSGTLVVCGTNLTEHLTIMAGNDEIFPLSTGRYEVTVSESGYHSTVNITVHNLTEHNQGVIPLVFFKCCRNVLDSQIWVDFKDSTDNVTFSYQFTSDTYELKLKLHCQAKGYPRAIKIAEANTANMLAHTTFSQRNFQPTMSLETSLLGTLCSIIRSYICEVTDLLGNKSTHTLHVTHTECPPRLFDVTTNNSVIHANVNDTAMFYFDVITSEDVIANVDSNRTQINMTRCRSHNVYCVQILLNSTQEQDFRLYTIHLKYNGSSYIQVIFRIELKDHPQFCYNPNPNFTIYTRPNENLSVNFCLKSGVDIQHQHKMEVYVDNQRLSDKDIQVTKYNSRYQYGLDIFLHRKTNEKSLWIEIKVFKFTLKYTVNIVNDTAVCDNDILKQPIPARLDQPLTIQFCVVSSSPLHDYIGINGHVIKVNTSHVFGLYRYVGVRRSGDDTYNVTIQLYPADVDGVQIFQVLAKNVEKEAMIFIFKVVLQKKQEIATMSYITGSTMRTSTQPFSSVTNSTWTLNDSSTLCNCRTENRNSFRLVVIFLITMATTSLILIIVLVCLVTHYKKMNRCSARFCRPTVHYDKCYFNGGVTYRDRYMNVEVTPIQDSESYRPSPTLELSNLHQYSEVQDVLTFTHYTEPTDTRGHQQSETHAGDILTLHAQERHYSVVDGQDSLAPSVGHLNQSAKAIEEQLTSQQVELLNDGYITPIDHYSTID